MTVNPHDIIKGMETGASPEAKLLMQNRAIAILLAEVLLELRDVKEHLKKVVRKDNEK